MAKEKYLKFLIIALAVAVIVPQIALAAWWNPFSWGIWNSIFHFQQTQQQTQKNQTPIVGGGKDSHGCVTDGGYSWCDAKQKCLRPWEEACDILSDVYPVFGNGNLKWGNAVVKTMNYDGVAIDGYEINSQLTVTNGPVPMDIFDYYDKKLKDLGWTDAVYFDADGITGHQVGYKKGNDYISISYNLKPGKITSGPNEPLQYTCPCDVTYSIFTTAPTQTADPNAGWKTYTNIQHGFTIDYPPNAKLTIDSSDQVRVFLDGVWNVFWVSISNDKTHLDYCLSTPIDGQKLEDVNIGGTKFNHIKHGLTTFSDENMIKYFSQVDTYSAIINNTCWLLETDQNIGQSASNPDNSHSDILNSIMNSFKFTK